MFKAKLIEDSNYYQIRRKQLIFSLLLFIPAAVLFNFYLLHSTWIIIVMLVIYIGLAVLLSNYRKTIKTKTEQQTIEIDDNQIRIIPKKNQPAIRIDLNEIDKITLKGDYEFELSEESLGDLAKEISGNQIQNFIIIEKDNQQQQFNFIVESHYMLKQLNKIILNWRQKGYPVEKVAA